MPLRKLYFDKNDYRLLDILNDVIDRKLDHAQFKTLLTPYLRPHGIKELAAPQGLRIAYAIVHLLNSLKSDQARGRLKALAALRDEVFASSIGSLRLNRARVLIQIAKELIRAKGQPETQLKLAHDFRMVACGKPHFLRRQLRRYHLLEMPEEWNQIAFDDRVHDANSKGRKSATHLIMDAWVKGIRSLSVIYYNHVERAVVSELFAAAEILEMEVRIGIEFKALFRGRFVRMAWTPRRLQDENDLETFFHRESVRTLMQDGREAQQLHTDYVMAVIEEFNVTHRKSIEQEFGVALPAIDAQDMASAMGCGQPSLLHLGKYIHQLAMPLFSEHTKRLAAQYDTTDYDDQARIAMQVESLNSLDTDTIVARYLHPSANRDILNPDIPSQICELPPLMRLAPGELVERLHDVSESGRIVLMLEDLSMEDVLEILYQCKGRINHLQLFNIKDMPDKRAEDRLPFGELQRALNRHNAVALKRIISDTLARLENSGTQEAADRAESMRHILNDFETLRAYYRHKRLKTSIGTGSTGQSSRNIGMGVAVCDTLPAPARKELQRRPVLEHIPALVGTTQILEFIPPAPRTGITGRILARASTIPVLRMLLCTVKTRWRITDIQVEDGDDGNLTTLGGFGSEQGNGLSLHGSRAPESDHIPLGYLNSFSLNLLKIIFGFIPAFLTFFLTKDWWIQAYLGGVIWFSITGVRNIIQSILGGGGLHRSPYLPWNEYVSWDRLADSLLYTGFSVPLLDWLCKSLLLKQGLGIDTTTAPLTLYTVMAITNGVYIMGHNLFRGLPRSAAFGNFFRSVFSIPIAVAFNFAIGLALSLAGHTDVNAILQLWAAVISKLASDCVAAVIEGVADRSQNIAIRRWDYAKKIAQIFETFSRMEVLYPNRNMLELLKNTKEFIAFSRKQGTDFSPIVIANALDLLYIRYYQPRAAEALEKALQEMTSEEKDIFFASQLILREDKEVARLFVDGLVGRDFTKPLSFYLTRYRDYLAVLKRLDRNLASPKQPEGTP